MLTKKFHIIPKTRTITAGMKESNSYFLCPAGTVMTGRTHSGDENGETIYSQGYLYINN